MARLAAQGLTNAVIARLRGTSVRTVANQMAVVLRELRVTSRRALATIDGLGPGRPSASPPWHALGAVHVAVLERACHGTQLKTIAIDLGMSPPTVSRVLRDARERLGLATFAELARAFCDRENTSQHAPTHVRLPSGPLTGSPSSP